MKKTHSSQDPAHLFSKIRIRVVKASKSAEPAPAANPADPAAAAAAPEPAKPSSVKVSWPSLDGATQTTMPIVLPKEPQVELVHQPDQQSKLVVTCTCGKRIEVAFES